MAQMLNAQKRVYTKNYTAIVKYALIKMSISKIFLARKTSQFSPMSPVLYATPLQFPPVSLQHTSP